MTSSTAGPPRIRLAQLPTPLHPLDNLSAELRGPRLWIKRDDLTEGPAGGNKLRKLEFSMGQAVAEGADVVLTAGAAQSNHCRQTAFAAARLGLRCHLVLRGPPPEGPPDGNLLLDALFGAAVTWVDEAAFDELPATFEAAAAPYRADGLTPFAIPVGASDEIGAWGYVEAAGELADDLARLDLRASHVVAAVGSVGTHAGLRIGAARYGLEARVLGISVARTNAELDERIDDLADRWRHRYGQPADIDRDGSEILDGYIGPGYGRAGPEVYETIRRVARLEGIVLDPVYTGKAFDALLREVASGRFDTAGAGDVVFLHTGGIYGTFPHRERLTAVVPTTPVPL
ncbi:MAG: D-cysteine desulfhydrase family protein [Actinomycetota bacterium]